MVLAVSCVTIKLPIFTVLSATAMLLMPESPVYLLKKGLTDPARKSLQWLRGPDYDIEKEIQQVTRMGQASADSSRFTRFTHIELLKHLVSGFEDSFSSALSISRGEGNEFVTSWTRCWVLTRNICMG